MKNRAPYPGLVSVCALIYKLVYISSARRGLGVGGRMVGGWTTEKALTDFA